MCGNGLDVPGLNPPQPCEIGGGGGGTSPVRKVRHTKGRQLARVDGAVAAAGRSPDRQIWVAGNKVGVRHVVDF